MPNDSQLSYTYIALGIITIILIFGFDHYAKTEYQIWPSNTGSEPYLLPPAQDSQAVNPSWINNKNAWSCEFLSTPSEDDYCGFYINLEEKDGEGIDFRRYQKLKIYASYKGASSHVSFVIRNYNKSYSSTNDGNSTKYMSVLLQTAEFKKSPIEIDLREFSVEDWWLSDNNTDRKSALPEFGNIVTIGLNMSEGNRTGINQFHLHKILAEGYIIKKETLNQYLLLLWISMAFLTAAYNLHNLYQEKRKKETEIQQLNQNNLMLLNEKESYRKLSTVDPLTNSLNRFGIDNFIKDLYKNLKNENQKKLSIIIADIDHFKRINDRRGHDAGDNVLKSFANILSSEIEKIGVLGRWGGEEFLIILPEHDIQSALKVAETIRQKTFNHVFFSENNLTVSASFGVAEALKEEDFSCLFKRADNALYRAKDIGRNCCILADTTPLPNSLE